MNSFPTFESESMGGCVSFRFCPINRVKKIPAHVSFIIASAVEFFAGYTWLSGLSLKDTLQFTEVEEKADGGSVYKTTINGMVPKMTPEYLALFEEMKRHKHVVEPLDNNGKKRLCGSPRAGMTFSYSSDSSTNPAGLSGYKFSFTLESPTPSPFYAL